MAKQNFVAGGYVGKLGETVGQRWKNKRTLRVYVIPANPRTERQQAGRAKFKAAIPLAQLGMMFNNKAPCWESETLTEWNQRTSVAKTNVDNGVSGSAAVPLFPVGYVPEQQATRVEYYPQSGESCRISLAVPGELAADRHFILSITCTNTATSEKERVMVEGVSEGGSPKTVAFQLSGHTLEEDDEIFGVTCDDAAFDNKMVHVPPQGIKPKSVLVIDDWSVTQESGTDNLVFQSQKLRQVTSDVTAIFHVEARNFVTGEIVSDTVTGTVAAGTGSYIYSRYTTRRTMSSGCSFGANGNIYAAGGELVQLPQVPCGLASKKLVAASQVFAFMQMSAYGTADTDEEITRIFVEMNTNESFSSSQFDAATVPMQSGTLSATYMGSSTSINITVRDGESDLDAGKVLYRFIADDLDYLLDYPQTGSLSLPVLRLELPYAILQTSYSGAVEIDV